MLPSLSRSSGILLLRNKKNAINAWDYYMVDRSVCGIAVYDLDKSIRSGTGMTYNYAVLKKKLPVTVIHPDTDSIIK